MPAWKKKLYVEAKKLKQPDFNFEYVWTKHGKMFVKQKEDTNTMQVYSFEDLDRIKRETHQESQLCNA